MSVTEPGGSLPGSLHYPLVFILGAWRFPLIQDHSLHGRGPQRAAFHGVYLLTNQTGLSAHFGVAEPTQDVLLLQVAALQTRLDVVLTDTRQ